MYQRRRRYGNKHQCKLKIEIISIGVRRRQMAFSVPLLSMAAKAMAKERKESNNQKGGAAIIIESVAAITAKNNDIEEK